MGCTSDKQKAMEHLLYVLETGVGFSSVGTRGVGQMGDYFLKYYQNDNFVKPPPSTWDKTTMAWSQTRLNTYKKVYGVKSPSFTCL